jgi:hypothetical protein
MRGDPRHDHPLECVVGPTSALKYPFALVFTPSDEFGLKNNYIYGPIAESQGISCNQRNTRNEEVMRILRGETMLESS